MLPFPIGTSIDRTSLHNQKPFFLSPDIKIRHLAIFGASGVGKSTLLYNLISHDIQQGLGVSVLDPHGNLVHALVESIPKSRTRDVIYLNPQDESRVTGINLLEAKNPDQKSLIVSYLISIIKNIWPQNWGPRSEYILNNAVYALLSQRDPQSLVALPKLLTDKAYRQKIVEKVEDPSVRSFFETYDTRWDKRYREEVIAPLLNKLDKFTTNPLLRNTIGQPRSSFDFREAMDGRKILLANLSKGALGEDVSSLLGSLIVTKLALAALSRQEIPERKRELHVLYADEVQNFIHGVSFDTILSEARKYGLAVAVATQTLAQLPKNSLSAVFGNCATLISFRVSGADAKILKSEFTSPLPSHTFQDLPDRQCLVKTLIKNHEGVLQPNLEPERVNASPPLKYKGTADRHKVIRTALERYARPKEKVEAKIQRFLSS